MTQQRSKIFIACVGNLFEHYDTALFGFLSPFLASLFFAQQDPLTALIFIYALIPLGVLAKPLGSIVFGYIGDKHGRENALLLSFISMAVITFCMAFLPTFQQVGVLAPLLLALGRVLQNFLAAGETMGGAIYLLEQSDKKDHGLLSGIYNASSIAGILLASVGVSLLHYLDALENGWRLLYLLGGFTALAGVILRKTATQPPAERSFGESPFKTIQNILQVFQAHVGILLNIALAAGFSYATYTISLVMLNGFIPLFTEFTQAQMSALNTFLLVIDLIALPLFGWISSKVSRERMMLVATLLTVVTAIPCFDFFSESSFWLIVLMRVWFVLLGVVFFAPYHAWAQGMVPQSHRYLLVSFGYTLGSQLFGGPTAAFSLWCYQTTGIVSSAAWYWLALGCASGMAILWHYLLLYKPSVMGYFKLKINK